MHVLTPTSNSDAIQKQKVKDKKEEFIFIYSSVNNVLNSSTKCMIIFLNYSVILCNKQLSDYLIYIYIYIYIYISRDISTLMATRWNKTYLTSCIFCQNNNFRKFPWRKPQTKLVGKLLYLLFLLLNSCCILCIYIHT